MGRAIDAACEVHAVAAIKTSIYGNSGGGFASLCAVARAETGHAVAANPQTGVAGYYSPFVACLATVLDPVINAQSSHAAIPKCWSATAAVQEVRCAERNLRPCFAQNLQDAVHRMHQHLPFCKQFGLPTNGGASTGGRVRSLIYSSNSGHGAEPTALVKTVASEGLPFLLGGT